MYIQVLCRDSPQIHKDYIGTVPKNGHKVPFLVKIQGLGFRVLGFGVSGFRVQGFLFSRSVLPVVRPSKKM